ncbi:MAG: hypothetical protein M4579_003170 [Chaenotheca gracillima]|nr:MAG: hypothetical protein M4579_003170 [Chaenotheca gracillima]
MAAQAVLIADTIAGMKKAISRRTDASDSDESIHQPTNRGNKLKRKAKFVREGQLDLPNGPRVYKRKVEHAGHKRYIISRNPQRLDEDGDELDEDDADDQADAAAAEEDPYADISIEHILAPLTSAAELPNHPSLSLPYYSKTLTEMAQYAGDVTQKEKAALWRTKQLLTKFSGDHTFAPCGMLESESDATMFESYLAGYRRDTKADPAEGGAQEFTVPEELEQIKQKAVDEESRPNLTTEAAIDEDGKVEHLENGQDALSEENAAPLEDVVMEDDNGGDQVLKRFLQPSNEEHDHKKDSPKVKASPGQNGESAGSREDADDTGRQSPNGNTKLSPPPNDTAADEKMMEDATEAHEPDAPAKEDQASHNSDDEDENAPAPHRMTTRAQAQQAASTTDDTTTPAIPDSLSPSLTGASVPFIHPLFLVIAGAHPDRDFGLPALEADETRRLLLSTAQKQEEVCRGHEKLYKNLLRADRMRKEVLKWTKAEAHVGEMSDGEDWYDKEEWNLEEDLRKGNEEDEEETTNQGKKTRGRRA